MNHFNSIRELLNTLSRGHKLLAEMYIPDHVDPPFLRMRTHHA